MEAGNRILKFYFLLFILMLLSCAPINNISESGQQIIIKKFPFYPQDKYQCGPASLAGVMNYLGISITPEEISKEIYSESARGTLDIDMVLYPQKKGLISEQYYGSIKDLKKSIDSGQPVIVLVDYGFSMMQINHFMVVIGYNNDGIIVNSGKEKEWFIPEVDFVNAWEKTKFWTLKIVKK